MFPSKVKIENLDPKITKAKDVEINATKGLTKGQIKKVAAKAGEKTPFYFIADFFVKNGKPIGDFLTLGNSMKLEKHFVQNEMKKSKKSVIDEKKQDPKKAAMGEIYVKDLDGKPTLHFEPHEKAKIPAGKWPKILKNLKPYLAGMKAVAVVGGKILKGEEDNNPEDASAVVDDVPAIDMDDNVVTVKSMASEYKDLLAEFKEAQAAEHDKDVVKILYKELVEWGKDYKSMNAEDQGKLAKFQKSFAGTLDSVKKIIKADSAIDKKVAEAGVIVKKYLEIADHSTPVAKKAHDEAEVILNDIIKYCKFIKDKELKTKCESLKSILAS